MQPRPASSTLFPYTTLFRSVVGNGGVGDRDGGFLWGRGGREGFAEDADLIVGKSRGLNSSDMSASCAVVCWERRIATAGDREEATAAGEADDGVVEREGGAV